MNGVLRQIQRMALLSAGDQRTDAQLLEAFLCQRDESAFECLLRRHGPMVFGVCRRVLGNLHDAEDSFQATFLILARKAGSLRSRKLLASWLYGVAYRTALKARAMSAKRKSREKAAPCAAAREAVNEGISEEWLAWLDLELNRLPERYRAPVVLCELEGKSRKEAARLLALPEGTLSWRLAHARKLLAQKLARHGTPLSGAVLAGMLAAGNSSAVPPATLLSATLQAGMLTAAGQVLSAGMVPAQVITLMEGVVRSMLLNKLKLTAWMVLLVAIGMGGANLAYHASAADSAAAAEATPPAHEPQSSAQARLLGDEIEALRLEIEALRKSLRNTQERVRSLEGSVQHMEASKRKEAAASQYSILGVPPVAQPPQAAGTFRIVPRAPKTAVDADLGPDDVFIEKAPGQRGAVGKTVIVAPSEKSQRSGSGGLPPSGETKTLEEARWKVARCPRSDNELVNQAMAALDWLRAHPEDRAAADNLQRALERIDREQAQQRLEKERDKLRPPPAPPGPRATPPLPSAETPPASPERP